MRLLLVIFVVLLHHNVGATGTNCNIAEQLDCNAQLPQGEYSGWTFGVGVASAQKIPHYLGSKQSRNFIAPVPYIRYDGKHLRISQSGITGKLFNTEKLYLSISLSGALPVDSSENKKRLDMPDISAVFEVGPSIKYYLSGDDNELNATYIDLNMRQAYSINMSDLGINSSPAFVHRQQLSSRWFGGKVHWLNQVKFEWLSDALADRFYSVSEQYQSSDRFTFKANGGYGGYRLASRIRWQHQQHIVSLFVGFADISSARYADSPLIEQQQHLYSGAGYFYIFD